MVDNETSQELLMTVKGGGGGVWVGGLSDLPPPAALSALDSRVTAPQGVSLYTEYIGPNAMSYIYIGLFGWH